MIRLALLLTVCSVTLCACKPGDSADLDATLRALEGRPLSTTQLQQVAAFVAASSVPDYAAADDVVSALIVADTVTPEAVEVSSSSSVYVPPCDPVQWRGNWYSCDMMVLIGPVE